MPHVSGDATQAKHGEGLAFAATMASVYAAVGVLYLVIPIAGEFDQRLLGSSLIPSDVILVVGIMEWCFQSLMSSSATVFDWVGGFPLENSLAMNENLLAWQLLYLPV